VDVQHHDVVLRDLSTGWFEALRDAPLVTLALTPQAAWVAEYYPNESVTYADDGSAVLTMRVTDPAWLRGLLLRLGGAARVLEPEGAGASAADAAQEALDAYGAVFAG
jgi:proteasome accessory factor C